MLKPRNVSGPPRKNWSMMDSFMPVLMGFMSPTAADICTTYISITTFTTEVDIIFITDVPNKKKKGKGSGFI